MTHFKYHLLLVCSTVIIAASFISAQILSHGMDPASLALMRFSLAALILAPFVITKKERRQIFLKILPKGLMISFFYATFFLIMFKALKTTTTLNTGTLYTLVPFLTALFSIVLFRDKIRMGTFLVYIISTVGTLWVIARGDINVLLHLNLNQGDILFLVGCFSMVGFSISMKLLYKGEDMLVFVFTTLLSGAAWMGASLLLSGQIPDYSKMTLNMSLHMAYLTVFATLVTSWIMQIATVKLSPRQVSAYIYLNPVFVALLTMLTTGQPLPVNVYPGITLSVIATILLQVQATRGRKA
ncbi:hypothetical protein PEC311524_34940 [Pectobacterium carotovorum subsp. carotovorum]|uniref:DMT family transporter n=1 Tax=Pectobacterium polonicum TaxID=2485124 RepID=UPI00207E57E6|nr:DMT family transporter [Pectobacterium polonicum]GKW25900.1 hypothetical protein PEC311524_34940 [Pectobacterium carotovorum subsp. carotovorum]